MTEKNRDILLRCIKGMSVRKPKSSNWDHISGQLVQYDAKQFITKNKGKLPKYTAPAGAWENISTAIPATSVALFFSSFKGRMITTSVILLGIIAAWLIFSGTEEKPLETIVFKAYPTGTPRQEETSEATIIQNKSNIIQQDIDVESHGTSEAEVIEENPFTPAPPPLQNNYTQHKQNTAKLLILETYYKKKIEQTSSNIPGRIIQDKDPAAVKGFEYYEGPVKGQIKAGISYSLKWIQQPEQQGMSIPENLSSYGLELLYEKKRWFFKTGLEYLGWKEKGNYTIDYDQFQLVYQYNYVDSAHVDPVNGHITYFTTEASVYDSVSEHSISQAHNEYKMLQIPLLIGYKFLKTEHFHIGIIGGIGIDIRLSGKQFTPSFDEKYSTIKNTHNSLQYRTGNNWRLIGGFEAGYIIGKNWELYAEPSYQWYMKPPYSPENTRGFGLFNIKFGLRYVF